MAIEVLAERPNMIVINKPSGLDCQSSRPGRPSLAQWLESTYAFQGLVHRLDFGTSGVMVCAKTPQGAKALTEDLQRGRIKRVYRALVMGIVKADEGTIDAPLEGKSAQTGFKVRDRFVNATELELTLNTGRKHRIRQHLLGIGHPVIGDHLYRAKGSHLLFDRPALHSWSLTLADGETFEVPLPTDIETLLQRLRKTQADRSI